MAGEITIADEGLGAAFEAAMSGKTDTTTVTDTTTADTTVTDTTTTDTTITTADTTTQQTDTKDYTKYFEELSEGYVKDDEGFKSVITKAKERDDFENKLKDLETKIPKFKNEESETLYKLWADGQKDAVINYVKETTKDYKTMSDLDVVKEALAKKNPTWSERDIDLELRAEYGKVTEPKDLAEIEQKDEDGKYTDEYKAALAYNEKIEESLLRLQRAARDSRITLLEAQSKIELPKISEQPKTETPKAPTPEETQAIQAQWEAGVDKAIPELKPIKVTVDDKEVEYSYSEKELKDMAKEIKGLTLDNFFKEMGWRNEDGTTNITQLAGDRQKIRKFDQIVQALSTQVKTAATKQTIAQIKNIDGTSRPATDATPQTFEEAFIEAKYGKAG